MKYSKFNVLDLQKDEKKKIKTEEMQNFLFGSNPEFLS